MSVEFNSSRSIDGLNRLDCDVINVVESIEIDGDNGNANQILMSDGTRTLYRDLSALLSPLSLSSPLAFVSGATYDGSAARTIEIPNLSIANGKLISSTISGVSLGSQLALLNVSGPLSYTSGTDYNGATTRTLQIADGSIGNAKLENSTISGKSLGSNLDNLHIGNGLLGVDLSDASSTTEYNGNVNVGMAVNTKAGGGLTADGTGLFLTNSTISGVSLGSSLNQLLLSTPLSYTSGADYDGSTGRTIQISNIANAKLQNSTISGISLGSNLQNLDLYYGLQFLSGTNYNGGTSRTLQTHLKTGGGLSQDGNGITLTETFKTISDRIHYVDTGVGSERYIYVFNSGDFRVNDDSSFYNLSIDDEINKVTGRARTMNSSIEAMAVITLPQGWTPTGILVDNRDSSGNNEPENLDVYKVRNYGGSNGTLTDLVGAVTTGTERTFTSSYGTASSEYSLLIKVHLNATSDYLGGGYIVLTEPAGL